MSDEAKQTKWTPGPWHVLQGDRCYHVASTDRTFETACIMFAGGEGDGAANARLIAAAPALYEALSVAERALKSRATGISALAALQKTRAALALVDGPSVTDEETSDAP